MKVDFVEESGKLMKQSTIQNDAPSWLLTEMVVEKGRELARKYEADEELVVASLYLAHIVFSKGLKDKIQQQHTKLSSRMAKTYLDKWKVPEEKQKIILNAIEAHHGDVLTESKEAEIMKNAECYKFITVKGCLILLHDLGRRGHSFEDAIKFVFFKLNQKLSYLTLDECKKDGEKNATEIKKIFGVL
jgi:hypothetical protein